jgi:hypothetical protein
MTSVLIVPGDYPDEFDGGRAQFDAVTDNGTTLLSGDINDITFDSLIGVDVVSWAIPNRTLTDDTATALRAFVGEGGRIVFWLGGESDFYDYYIDKFLASLQSGLSIVNSTAVGQGGLVVGTDAFDSGIGSIASIFDAYGHGTLLTDQSHHRQGRIWKLSGRI